MKLKIALLFPLVAGVVLIATWRVCAGTVTELPTAAMAAKIPTTAKDQQKAQEMQQRVQRQSSAVRARLERPALIAEGEDPGLDEEINELYRSGWIIDATLDEVEAALKAAAATPSLEDDIEARKLAHRASCRYFLLTED